MHGRRIGSLIGLVGGLVFVLVNLGAADLPGLLRLVVLVITAALAVLTVVTLWRDAGPGPPPPSARGQRVYGLSVLGLLVAVPVGSLLLGAVGLPELRPCWLVVVLGAHFVPFARAFGTRLYVGLAAALIGVGVIGAVLTAAGSDRAPGVTAVVAGLVLLGFAAAGPLTRAGDVPRAVTGSV